MELRCWDWVRIPERTRDWPSFMWTLVPSLEMLRPGTGVPLMEGVRSLTSACTLSSISPEEAS